VKIYNSPDKFITDLFGLSSVMLEHPFVKNIMEECKCDDSCECDEVSGILHANVKAFEDKYVMIAEIPGLTDDDIVIDFKDDKITVTADYKKEEEFTKIRNGKWTTSFKFKDIDSSSIVAKLDKGQLFITISKKPEAQPIKIKVEK